MSVVMKGGPSGMRNMPNVLANVPSSGSPQPVLDTSHSGNANPDVKLMLDPSGNRESTGMPPVPTGGTVPEGSTDVCDPDAHR